MSEGVAAEHKSGNTAHDTWAESMQRRYNAGSAKRPSSRTEPCTIHRVPHSIRQVDEDAYEPKMLSIGPYHRSNPKLQAMEDHKWRYLQTIIDQDPERRSLGDFLREMEKLEGQARSCYSENIQLVSPDGHDEFVEMMLLDGCFIVQLFLNSDNQDEVHVEVDDPIHSTDWILPIIRQDMLLLENQLPFLVLERLFQLINRSNSTRSLVDLALQFFRNLMPMNRDIPPMNSAHHLLHLYHWHLLPMPPPRKSELIIPLRTSSATNLGHITSPQLIPSAKEIQYSGIRLRRKESASSILDAEFKDGILKIPPLRVDHSTKSIFRNLIALEQCYPKCGTHFTSYAIFMNCLVDTPQDVAILKTHKIVEHWLGTDEEVSILFNSMCRGISYDLQGSFLSGLFDRVMRYGDRLFNKYRADLIINYFGSPWAIINLQFTVMTIIFTVVQTVLAVLSYNRS